MAIGECAKLPTAQPLAEQPRGCFFMSWAELTFENNSNQDLQALYQDGRVVTRDELPKLR